MANRPGGIVEIKVAEHRDGARRRTQALQNGRHGFSSSRLSKAEPPLHRGGQPTGGTVGES
jgi:hypothetical protein